VVSICPYFQVHQPFRLRKYPIFDIGKNHRYFDYKNNVNIMAKVVKKCYMPTNNLLLNLIRNHPEFKVSFSFTGVFLEQLEERYPKVLDSFQKLVDTGNVEVLSETHYHSLAFLYSKKEFKRQVTMHGKKIEQLFGVKPQVFRNTELIYNNELAKRVEDMGYKAILAEGADHILQWRSPNFVYRPKTTENIRLLLKNYRLSDDVAFRFSQRTWNEWPLTAPKYASWVNNINGNGQVVNLFMDYETFGEHQWAETGIFKFLKHLPNELLKHPDNDFKTPSEVARDYKPVAELDIHNPISWADVERDLSAWLGNKMQQSAVSKLYELENEVKATQDKDLIEDWRKLQTSDHFYYMCTKWFNDGDVHKYFNPYDSPYDAFITFMNIIHDLKHRINLKKEVDQNAKNK